MAQIVAENTSPSPPRDSTGPFYDSRDTTPRSPTLGEILNLAGSVKNVSGDESPSDQVVDVDDTSNQPRAFPFVLSFSNLSYNVKIRNKLSWPTSVTGRKTDAYVSGETHFARTKVLLDGISGEARDGEIMAVMGASGSGKSTLIDALANRIAKGRLEGSVKINGEELESRLMKIISAHVMQDDLLFPMLTVEETLMFAADFRLPRKFSKSKKKTRAQALIDQLGLRAAAKTIIGDEGHRGVSGGERRRVSIGIDIIHDPILLFLDEPTSGLDSSSAFMVVKVLQRIAQSGSIIIMSIHQPSYRILGLLDKMIFLSRGHTIYSGPPSNLPLFFADFGHPIPENENPAEFVLDLVLDLEGSPGGTKSLVEFNNCSRTRKNMDSTTFSADNLSLKQAISGSISRGKLVSGVASNETSSKSEVPTYANPFWIETAVLSKRAFMNSRRTPELFAVRLGLVMVTGFLLATIYWQLDNSPKGIKERFGFLSFAIGTTFYICAAALPGFIQERYIFMRETAHNAYRISSYVLSHSLVVLPSLLFSSLAFSITTFWAVGLDGGPSGFIFYFLIILASFWTGNSFITLLSGFVPHVTLGYVIAVAVLSYFSLFSGFYINRDRIPFYWIWFHYISLVKYPYEAVLQNEFGDPNKCFVKGVEIFDTTPLAGLPLLLKERILQSLTSSLGMNITDSTCFTTGADILKQQAITDLSKWNCLWITVAWGFLFRILFYFSLLLGSRNKRR